MKLLEALPEVLELIGYGLSTAGLSLASTRLERIAFASINSGETTFGLWAAYMGVVMLSFAYVVGTDRFAPKLAEVKDTAGVAD
jgi:hypothetical protein